MRFSMSPEEQARRASMRRAAEKLAGRKSRKRVVKRLPQTVRVVRPKGPGLAQRVRQSLNRRKRLAYILLLGAVLCAYVYDSDVTRLHGDLYTVQETVEQAREFYLGA